MGRLTGVEILVEHQPVGFSSISRSANYIDGWDITKVDRVRRLARIAYDGVAYFVMTVIGASVGRDAAGCRASRTSPEVV